MSGLDIIKNNLIDRILATKNEQLLTAISNIFESTQSDEKIYLSSSQLEILHLSEKDIEYGNIVSEDELDQQDKEWLS